VPTWHRAQSALKYIQNPEFCQRKKQCTLIARTWILYIEFMGLPIVHHPHYNAELATGHRFPIGKFRRLAEILLEEGLAGPAGFHQPDVSKPDWITLVHHKTYVDQVLTGQLPIKITKDIGFPVDESLVLRALCASGGTLLAAELALEFGISCNTAGGGHHARHRQGAGFCVFNDVAIAIRVLQQQGKIERALVVDCDVHQGDGTADIFFDDPSVFTFSIHADKNYPTRKRPSDLDIGLADGTGDADYLLELRNKLPLLMRNHRPDLVIFNGGVDPHHDDHLGRLRLTDDGLQARDRFVIELARSSAVPIACVVGGGYSKDMEILARRHAGLYRVAATFA